jgi:acetate kinase
VVSEVILLSSNREYILTINTGSSSIKFALFRCDEIESFHFAGELSNIGSSNGLFLVNNDKGQPIYKNPLSIEDHENGFSLLIDWLTQHSSNLHINTVGHRIVHGGETYREPVIIDATVIDKLKKLIPYDPIHMKSEVMGILCCQKVFPEANHVACFDTAFHHTLPDVARRLPIPKKLDSSGIRRYGFHGLSYEYIYQTLKNEISEDEADGRVIIAHLGSGASIAALHHGKSLDTSMGFTSNSGLMMSTRSGDLDPGLIFYLQNTLKYDSEELEWMLSKESGLKGISESSSDMKQLLDEEIDNPDAAIAIDIFCYTVRKYIGAYAAALGGIDTLVFTGGIGEHSAAIRSRICKKLEFLEIKLEEESNHRHALLISQKKSRVHVRVIQTNEELMIARHAHRSVRSLVS